MTQKTTQNPWTMDVRVRERNLRAGSLTEKELEKNLAALPDLADQAEPFVTAAQPALAPPPAPVVVASSSDDDFDGDDEDEDDEDEDDDVVAEAAPVAAVPAVEAAPSAPAAPSESASSTSDSGAGEGELP